MRLKNTLRNFTKYIHISIHTYTLTYIHYIQALIYTHTLIRISTNVQHANTPPRRNPHTRTHTHTHTHAVIQEGVGKN